MLTFYCIHCGLNIEAEDGMVGMEANCPSCLKVSQVPGATDTPLAPPPQRPVSRAAMVEPGSNWRWVMVATFVSGVLGFVMTWLDPMNSWKPTSWLIVQSLMVGLMLICAGLVAGVVVGGVFRIFGGGFVSPCKRTYGVVTITLAVAATIGQMLPTRHVWNQTEKGRATDSTSDTPLPGTLPAPSDLLVGRDKTSRNASSPDRVQLKTVGLALYNDLVDQSNAYQRSFKKLNVTRVLDSKVMADSAARTEVLKGLAEARKMVGEAKDKALNLLAGVDSRVDASAVPNSQKAFVKAALQKAVANSTPLLTDLWNEEVKGCELLESIGQVIKVAGWKVLPNGYGFADPKDLESYKTKLDELQQTMKDHDAKREEAFESLRLAVILPGEK